MKEVILASYNYGSGLVTATATNLSEEEGSDEVDFTLTVNYHGGSDPGDTVEVDVEYRPGSLTIDGLKIAEEHGLVWLDRLIKMKREEAAEEEDPDI